MIINKIVSSIFIHWGATIAECSYLSYVATFTAVDSIDILDGGPPLLLFPWGLVSIFDSIRLEPVTRM